MTLLATPRAACTICPWTGPLPATKICPRCRSHSVHRISEAEARASDLLVQLATSAQVLRHGALALTTAGYAKAATALDIAAERADKAVQGFAAWRANRN